ncbi:MAG: hypothetical protein ACR2I8_05630 [Steroidobacteraceae bacterium]
MKALTRCALMLAYAWSAVALGAQIGAQSVAADVSKVNGSVHLESGRRAGDVSTVNGSVTIAAGAGARDVETVNGSVRIEARAGINSAESVNGAITVGEGAQVAGRLETVNGDIRLRRGARVAGGVGNVNGELLVDGAEVQRGIETVNGDIRLTAGSVVTGGIRVHRNGGKFWQGWGTRHNPRLTLEAGATLQGPLRLEREVDLYVAPGVDVPAVEGVAPKRHTLQ